jgi:hypothetical protein
MSDKIEEYLLYPDDKLNLIIDWLHDNLDFLKVSFDKLEKNKENLKSYQQSKKNIRYLIFKLIDFYKHSSLKETLNLDREYNYTLTIADDPVKIKLFIIFNFLFDHDARLRDMIMTDNNKKTNIGIDFEYNLKKVALMQINYEMYNDRDNNMSYLWLVNPDELTSEQTKIIIDKLFVNQYIYKIFHGPDALDIPYIFEYLFNNNRDLIIQFTHKLLDTKFMCEYFKLSKKEERVCGLYGALEYFGTINHDKYEELIDINNSMGPVQDISWNIHKLSSYHIKYAYYDVLYSQHYLYDTYKKIKQETPQYIYSYYFVNEIIRFVLLERREIIRIVEDLKTVINPINNYIIGSNNQTLHTYYNSFIENRIIHTKDGIIYYDFLLLTPFLKKVTGFLFKSVIYCAVASKSPIYVKRGVLMRDKISMITSYTQLEELKFNKILKLLKILELECLQKFK